MTSLVYARDGYFLGAVPAPLHREPVTYDRMSRWIHAATVAAEDRRFWKNDGLDYTSIARAALADLSAGRAAQGASTITQQLVRNLYLNDGKTLARKRVEACLALELAKVYTKPQILEDYLNRIPYGHPRPAHAELLLLHHRRPEGADDRPEHDARRARPSGRSRVGPRLDRPAQRRDQGSRLELARARAAVRPPGRRSPPDRLRLQAVRPDRPGADLARIHGAGAARHSGRDVPRRRLGAPALPRPARSMEHPPNSGG